MSNPSTAAATARQTLASVLGSLQQDPNCPPGVLEIVGGLAKAMGPLFQLERGSTDLQLFVQARTVLQQTLEKIQTVDQNYPGVGDATGAIAQSLGIIFAAMRDAGMVAPSPGAPPAASPSASAMPAAAQPAGAPFAQAPAAFAATQIQPNPQPIAAAPQPMPLTQPKPAPVAAPQPAAQSPFAPQPARPAPAPGPVPGGRPVPATTGSNNAPTATVPVGPNGLPRLEGEVGVHSETNFYTDFLGDIRNHGGIFVATFHVLPMGAPCEVLLTFPGNLTAEIRGNVRWKRESDPGVSLSSSPGLGIEITEASADAWGLIERFIRKREPIMHEM